MKTPTQMNKWQKATLILIAVCYLYNITTTLIGLTLGEEIARSIASNNRFLIGTLAVLSAPLTLFFLSKTARNTATRRTLTAGGCILSITNITGLVFSNINSLNSPTNPLFFASSYLIFTLTTLYILGVITRNNTLDKKTTKVINIYFAITFILSPIISILCTIIDILSYYNLAESLLMSVLWYMFIDSNIFNGEKDYTPAPEGAYRFRNKYLSIWAILFLVATIIMFAVAIYAAILLEKSAPLD